MLSFVSSCGLAGIEGFAVEVEVNLSNGMVLFEIVGLPDASVKESRERVRAALKNNGFHFPAERLTINLAPADIKKEGPSYDLPIALGILVCLGRRSLFLRRGGRPDCIGSHLQKKATMRLLISSRSFSGMR